MITKITCPQCKREIEINEALDNHVREQILAAVKLEHQKHLEDVRKKAVDEYTTELQFMKKQLEEKEQKVHAFREQELKLREEKAKIEEEKKDFELTMKRRLDEEKKKTEQLIADKLEKDYKLKLLEREQVIENMNKKIEELQKRSNVTSQQLQGEVLELDVQNTLLEAFPDDEIVEVEKFKNGSDIKQLVKSRKGMPCGKILWECKRTNLFKSDFIEKLKEDMLREEAHFGIIVATTLPKQALHGMAKIEGVWICSLIFVECLATILRESLINIAKEKWMNDHKGNKGDQLIAYFNSTQFSQQVRENAESLLSQKAQINKERTVYTKLWADRELQIDRQTRSIAKILSTVQSIVGSGMQHIEAFDLMTLADGKE